MIFIYLPNFLLFFVWLYHIKLNIFLSIILTPLSYLAINGGLIYYKQFELAHLLLDKTIVLPFTENLCKKIILYVIHLIFKISYVNKLYTLLKVKVFVYIFNLIASYMTNTNNNQGDTELTSDLQNDYLEILNRNRRKRASSPSVRNSVTESGMD
jgi:hypothetical protein